MSSVAGNIEGRVDIGLRLSDGVVTGVHIQSSRPLQTPRIFVGKSVEQLLQTLPLLYSICGTAQAQAAVTACEQALGIPMDGRRQSSREKLVWLETAKEHLWRVLLDWPGFIGLPTSAAAVAQMLLLIKRFRHVSFPNERPFVPGVRPGVESGRPIDTIIDEVEQLLREQVFGMPPAKWLELESGEALLGWAEQSKLPAARMLQYLLDNDWASLGSTRTGALPPLQQDFLQQQLEPARADRFIAQPQLDGACQETSPFTRTRRTPLVGAVEARYGAGLLARFSARLVELAGIPGRLRAGPDVEVAAESGLPEGCGIAQVEAARGRLVHRLQLADGQIGRYQILAPTEWNFHPDGVLAEGLRGIRAASVEALRQQAALLVSAIDPCVGYELQIERD